MKNRFLMTVSVAAISLVAACSEPAPSDIQNVSAAYEELLAGVEVSAEHATIFESNPLLAEWTGPYQGVPAFDTMSLNDLKPALEAAMAKNLAEVVAIANNPEPATFANTIVAMEDTGRELGNLFTYWGIWSANMSSPEFRAIQQEMAPVLSAFFSKVTQNENLCARIKAVYEGDEMASLSEAEQRLVWLNYDGFARNGATLEGAAK
ncbi:MAG: M3 family metallopeptidase, partial [Alphaproteobacteria bacterium]